VHELVYHDLRIENEGTGNNTIDEDISENVDAGQDSAVN